MVDGGEGVEGCVSVDWVEGRVCGMDQLGACGRTAQGSAKHNGTAVA